MNVFAEVLPSFPVEGGSNYIQHLVNELCTIKSVIKKEEKKKQRNKKTDEIGIVDKKLQLIL